MSNHSAHERMKQHLKSGVEALARHRDAMSEGVVSHLDETAKIGADEPTTEVMNNGND